jgi:hypothetical protein
MTMCPPTDVSPNICSWPSLPLYFTSLGRFIPWMKREMDYMDHERMFPNGCFPTPTVRDKIRMTTLGRRATDDMSLKTTIFFNGFKISIEF